MSGREEKNSGGRDGKRQEELLKYHGNIFGKKGM